MHIVSKFQFFIHIFTMVKLTNKTPTFKKNGRKRAFFCNFFKVHLNELISSKLHIYVKIRLTILSIKNLNIAIIKTYKYF